MRIPRFFCIIFAALLALLAERDVCGQWKKIVQNLVKAPSGNPQGGIIINKKGILWAAYKDVWMSKDLGQTWSLRSPFKPLDESSIYDIAFFDDMIGVIVSSSGAYITHDQGLSWSQISSSAPLVGVCFAGSPNNIIACGSGVMVTTDGGVNWSTKFVDGYDFNVRSTESGTVYLIAGKNLGGGILYMSSDFGFTWKPTSGRYDWDSFSFERDLCDTTIFYVSNEEIAAPTDNLSEVYVTHNSGSSWKSVSSHSLPYYCGSVAVSANAVFVQTYSSIQRSTDQGTTWKSIGGPPNILDTRFVTAIDNNIIFAVDGTGSIWKSINSGGDSLRFGTSPKNSISIKPDTLFERDSLYCISSVPRSIAFRYSGCSPPIVISKSVIGVDSLSYILGQLTYDSIQITFHPHHNGSHKASLVINLDNGGHDTVQLRGFNDSIYATYLVNPPLLFGQDSLYTCDSISIDKVYLNSTHCQKIRIISQKIIGTYGMDYSIDHPIISDTLSLFDSVTISFKTKAVGLRNAFYQLLLDNGDTITVPLEGFGKGSTPFTFSLVPQELFLNDSLFSCDSPLTKKLVISSNQCPAPHTISQKIIGVNNIDYSIISSPLDTLSGNDSVLIVFQSHGLGLRNAIYQTILDNGDTVNVPLEGFGKGSSPFSFSLMPQQLFTSDSLFNCDSPLTRKLIITSNQCPVPHIISQKIIGVNNGDYSITASPIDSLSGHDSVLIFFKSTGVGMRDAIYQLELDNGNTISVPLNGFSKGATPFSYSISPQRLFSADSIYICISDTQKIIFTPIQCPMPNVVSQKITGTNNSDYYILNPISISLQDLDSAILIFTPDNSGSRNATYELTLDNGTTITIPLQGFGIAPHILSCTTTNQSTDTIGGSFNIPITISGLDHPEDVELVMHYDNDLKYDGSFSGAMQLDMPKEQWAGRSKLHIAQAKPDVISGYAKFEVFGDSTALHVTFDSMTVLTAISPCQYILPAAVTSTITPPSGCGDQILTRFLLDSTMPQFEIIPNPSSAEISITSSRDLGAVSITIYDMLGAKRGESIAVLGKNSPAKVMLPTANGVYNVRVSYGVGKRDLRVVVNH